MAILVISAVLSCLSVASRGRRLQMRGDDWMHGRYHKELQHLSNSLSKLLAASPLERNPAAFAGWRPRQIHSLARHDPRLAIGALQAAGCISMSDDSLASSVPKVLFVLGGPGAGKGTQCEKILEHFPSWAHVSAGDCLRAERNDPTSKDGEVINSYIKDGKIVPAEITVKLLQKAMAKKMKAGRTRFLIDGFPRNEDNVKTWKANVGEDADVEGVLFFDVDEEELQKRLLERGKTSGRTDDNIDSIKKRFATHEKEQMPVVEAYRAEGKVFSVDARHPVEDVWASTQPIIEKLEASK
mmetsp:Transcript_123187/g.223900  ORF Transcript_123187/g.223900 Transcript_123187/m.223900 type:complete len:298 (-) Transcript_123187:235-1128(-)